MIVVKVKHRYPFSSALKRMSVIVECLLPGEQKSGLFVFIKGAPEVLAAHMVDIPSFYQGTYVYHMTRGKRVLALAYRHVPTSDPAQALQELRDAPRSKVETGLIFAGFLVFDCDLKADSKSVVRELRGSDHKVIMITGDSAYTAADVAAKLGMIKTTPDSGLLILESRDVISPSGASGGTGKTVGAGGTGGAGAGSSVTSSQSLVWRKAASAVSAKSATKSEKSKDQETKEVKVKARVKEAPVEIAFDPSKEALKTLALGYSLCVTGTSIATMLSASDMTPAKESALLQALCPQVTIFARVSPSQKVQLI